MKKSGTMKKMLTYYKPYMRVFWTDMFFATLSAAVALIIPLVVRYVTYNLVYREPAEILHQAAYIAIGLSTARHAVQDVSFSSAGAAAPASSSAPAAKKMAA